jgi:hypothetical protein
MIITESKLDAWVRGNHRDAQGLIVNLILNLISGSCPNPKFRRFPLCDSIGQHGTDGELDVEFGRLPFVPEGRSFWEFGVGEDALKKANGDYEKDTRDIHEDVRKNSSFIFVTPLSAYKEWRYTWKKDEKAAWIEERKKENKWKDVRVIDGTILVDWLKFFPAVERWLAKKMGIEADGLEYPGERWEFLRSIGEPPPLIPDVFCANREAVCEKLKDVFVENKIRDLQIETKFPDQMADCVCAYIAGFDPEQQMEINSRCLIVKDPEALKEIITLNDSHVIIMDCDISDNENARLKARVTQKGHSVISHTKPGGYFHVNREVLRNPTVHQIQEALIKAKYPEERARTIALKSDGNLKILERLILGLSGSPAWSERSEAADLAIAQLLGDWRENNNADIAVAEQASGKSYGEWIRAIRAVANLPNPPLIQRNNKWSFISRFEGWTFLAPRLHDNDLDRFKKVATSVLKEQDPQFEIEKSERYLASVKGKNLLHSRAIRLGIAEGLALMGSIPRPLSSCSVGKGEAIAASGVRDILSENAWQAWASVDQLLPNLAEASPEEFLSAVERALNFSPCPFIQIFKEEGDGITGGTHISGLLWALETLAWDARYLGRVALILGDLHQKDPGGKWTNRPLNSLTTIFIPWLPQTIAPLDIRKTCLHSLMKRFPTAGWKALVSLMPTRRGGVSSGSHRPSWREFIPADWKRGVSVNEYWVQVGEYARMAIDFAKNDALKLIELTNYLESLPENFCDEIIDLLSTDATLNLSQEDKLEVWTEISDLILTHTKFSDADWAMEPSKVERLKKAAEKLKPSDPLLLHRRLFSERDFSLYEEKDNFKEQQAKLEERRTNALKEIFDLGGAKLIAEFSEQTETPWRVGFLFGKFAPTHTDKVIFPYDDSTFLNPNTHFVGGYIQGRFSVNGWRWFDSLDLSPFAVDRLASIFSMLPFDKETWVRAERRLGPDEVRYWELANVMPYAALENLNHAMDKLAHFGRIGAAIHCLYTMVYNKNKLDTDLAVKVLLSVPNEKFKDQKVDSHDVITIISALQKDQSVKETDLIKIEWAYLSILDNHYGGHPITLEKNMAISPQFFVEVLQLVYISTKEDKPKEISEPKKNIATNAYHLISNWKTVPGVVNSLLDVEKLNQWFNEVKRLIVESGHLDIGMSVIGHVLIYCPPDPSGLWIHKAAASLLDGSDAKHMRDGFQMALYNARGGHFVDPQGKPEMQLAKTYEEKAQQLDLAGFHQFAATMRQVAENYRREAQAIREGGLFDI